MTAAEQDALFGAAQKAFSAPFGGVLKLAAEPGPALWVDGRQTPPRLITDDPNDAAHCIWRGARDVLIRALGGARAFESAYVSGRISAAGDMSVMARINLDECR